MLPINVSRHDLQENHFANTKLDKVTATIYVLKMSFDATKYNILKKVGDYFKFLWHS